MDPTDALRSIEIALRLLIKDVLGASQWLEKPGAPDADKLRDRRDEEKARRDSAIPSDSLLDYTETHHLTGIIEKNWELFKPALSDKRRTEAFFSVMNEVRNSIAHSRDLVPHEVDLISGIAGYIRNQISRYRSDKDASARYYPLIESIVDNYGRDRGSGMGLSYGPRQDIGNDLTFTGRAFNATGKNITWGLFRALEQSFLAASDPPLAEATGDSVSLTYRVAESDIGEGSLHLIVRVANDSPYHRNQQYHYDDEGHFAYSVNPPY